MSTLLRLRARSSFCSLVLLPLLGISLGAASLNAQTASSAATAKPSAAPSGFSIETEMLTYRALESNGEAIACDVASYLYNTKTDFRDSPNGKVCNVGSSGQPTLGVVVLPFDRSLFADFEIWRSDMQTMAEFEVRGAQACKAAPPPPASGTSAPPEAPHGRGLTATTTAAAGAAGAFTPAGAAISTASGVLGLFAHSQDSSPVGGTIEDQAFMDNVSRALRTVNISVLMPSAYTPYTLDSIDPARSPFVTALDKLLHTRDCLVALKEPANPDLKNIDDFLAVLASTTAPAKSTAPGSASGSGSARLRRRRQFAEPGRRSSRGASPVAPRIRPQRRRPRPAPRSRPRHRKDPRQLAPAPAPGQGARVRRLRRTQHQHLRHQDELQRRFRRNLRPLQPRRRTRMLRQRLRLRRLRLRQGLRETPPRLQTQSPGASHLPARRVPRPLTRHQPGCPMLAQRSWGYLLNPQNCHPETKCRVPHP